MKIRIGLLIGFIVVAILTVDGVHWYRSHLKSNLANAVAECVKPWQDDQKKINAGEKPTTPAGLEVECSGEKLFFSRNSAVESTKEQKAIIAAYKKLKAWNEKRAKLPDDWEYVITLFVAGLLPLCMPPIWYFFLVRIRELSDAIRGC